MQDKKLHKLVETALLAALVCTATMVIQIPSPANGYVNLGDCFVLLSAYLLGPWYGAAAAGIGSMLTDLLLGYAHYAPGTLVIKGLMAVVAALLYRRMDRKLPGMVVSAVAAELVMVAGYFFYAALLLGSGWGAALSIPGNLVQGLAGIAGAVLLMQVIHRTKLAQYIVV